jgi:Xaa-Pro dipeptidase
MKKEFIYIKKACNITDKILHETIENIKNKKLKTEKQISLFILNRIKELGYKRSFKPIVANNSKKIHHRPRKKKLEKGFLILDLGVKYKGYCSDLTRTIYIGNPSKYHKKLYNLVKNAQLKAIKNLKLNKKYKDIDASARKTLKNYRKYFKHSLGHGVGKRIHQAPRLGPKNNRKLKNNIIFTIEPGIYFKKVGIRIEDTILFKNKPILLTKSPKNLITI